MPELYWSPGTEVFRDVHAIPDGDIPDYTTGSFSWERVPLGWKGWVHLGERNPLKISSLLCSALLFSSCQATLPQHVLVSVLWVCISLKLKVLIFQISNCIMKTLIDGSSANLGFSPYREDVSHVSPSCINMFC